MDKSFKALKRFFRKSEFDCEDVVDYSSARIENDLKPDKRSAFQAHPEQMRSLPGIYGNVVVNDRLLG